MKRREIIRRIREAAAAKGLECEVVELTNHTGIKVGRCRSTLTRSSKDFGPAYAARVWSNFEAELGEGWWR